MMCNPSLLHPLLAHLTPEVQLRWEKVHVTFGHMHFFPSQLNFRYLFT